MKANRMDNGSAMLYKELMEMELIRDLKIRQEIGQHGGMLKADRMDDGGAVTYKELYLRAVETEYIRALEIRQEIGQHGSMYLEAVLNGEAEENDIHGMGKTVTLMFGKSGEKRPLFYGVIDKMQTEKDGEGLVLKLKAWDATCLMDTEKRLIAYQDIEMAAGQLMDGIMKAYPGSDYKVNIPEEPVGQFLVQYEETDWEFLKRLFARYHAALCPDPAFDGIRIQAGASPDAEPWDWDALPFELSQDFEEFNNRKRNGFPGISCLQNMLCKVAAYDIASLGNKICYKGNPWYIKSLERKLEKGILVNHYHMGQEEGLNVLPYMNPRIAGVSINGKVRAVKRDRIQVDMEADSCSGGRSGYYFPYSTVASSPDGSGWYCMPETGESVRVYFPTDDEKEAYVVTNIEGHAPEQGDASDPMGNPNVRNLQTAQGNQVQFTEEGVLISAGNGQGSILLKKSGEVALDAVKDVTLSAGKAINIVAANEVIMKSQTSIQIANGTGADIEMKKGQVQLHGMLINEN